MAHVDAFEWWLSRVIYREKERAEIGKFLDHVTFKLFCINQWSFCRCCRRHCSPSTGPAVWYPRISNYQVLQGRQEGVSRGLRWRPHFQWHRGLGRGAECSQSTAARNRRAYRTKSAWRSVRGKAALHYRVLAPHSWLAGKNQKSLYTKCFGAIYILLAL